MRTAELVGYLASALVFATFYMKTLTPMRAAAIASNVAFICYGYLGEMIPILILHSPAAAAQRLAVSSGVAAWEGGSARRGRRSAPRPSDPP